MLPVIVIDPDDVPADDGANCYLMDLRVACRQLERARPRYLERAGFHHRTRVHIDQQGDGSGIANRQGHRRGFGPRAGDRESE